MELNALTHDPDGERPTLAFAGDKKRPWFAYRSSPYGWERLLIWLMIVLCFGINAGKEIAHVLALAP